jgi:hypothetical protein
MPLGGMADAFGQGRIFMLSDALRYESEAVEHRNAAAQPE